MNKLKAQPKDPRPVSVEELLQAKPPTPSASKSSDLVDVPDPDIEPALTDSLNDEIDRLTDEKNDLKQKVDELDAVNLQLRTEVSRLKALETTLTITNDRNVAELQKARADLAAIKKGYETAQSNIETLNAELARSEEKRKNLRVALSNL